MVAQALPLIMLAEAMGMSIPIVTDYYKTKGIDLSGYDANDTVPLEVLLPEQAHMTELKSQRDWSQSFYQPKPVVEDTALSEIIVQSDQDDDEVIDVKEEESGSDAIGRTLSTEPPEDPKDPDPDLILEGAETVARKLAEEGAEKLIDKTIEKLEKKFNQLEEKKKQVPSDIEEREKFYEENVGYHPTRATQKNAMLKINMFHSGVLSPDTLENIGDLTHRITEFPFVLWGNKRKSEKNDKGS